MSLTRRPEGGRLSRRSGRLLLLAALFLAGAARPGAAQAPPAVSFLPPITYDQPAPAGLERVIGNPLLVADVDGDGRLDLVVVTKDGLSILYGSGDGTFAPEVDLPLGPGLQEGTVADVNGDGLPDLVYCDFDRGKVAVLINQGGRQFSSPHYYAASDGPVGITAADFNGDGRPDLAVACHLSGDLVVLLNRGDGSFLPPVSLGRTDYPGAVLSADLNGDGNIDLAEASLTENVVRLLLGDGTGKFTEKGRYGADDGYPARGVAADFNGDGIPDLAIGCQDQYAIFFGDGRGGLGPAVRYSYPGGYILGAGDFDGDGAPDLVTPNRDAGGFSVYLNRQAGNFLPALTIPRPGEKTSSLVVGDFNGDGRPDVVAWNETSPHLAVFLNSTPQPSPAIRSLTLDSANVIGGCQSVTGTVTLTAPAPAQGAIGGVVVLLASSNPAVTVPAGLLIPQGALQARFSVAASVAAARQWASISASYGGTAKRAALVVQPMGPPQVTINPVQVIGGQTAAGQVTIPCPAGPGGLVIALSSSSSQAAVPAAVTVPPGATTAAFPVLTYRVAAATTVMISAGPPGTAAMASLQLLPASIPPPAPATPASTALALFPNPVPGGLLALGEVTLSQPAGPSGVTVTLASSAPVAAVPATIAVLPGAGAATFPILTFPVTQPASVTISASSFFGSASTALQLLPLGGVPATTANLLVNGSFEEPDTSSSPYPWGYAYGVIPGYPSYQGTTIPGWRITAGTIDVLSQDWPAADGRQSIDLVGSPGAAIIEQSFPTEPGRDYLFSGYVSHNYNIPYGRADVLLDGVPFVQLTHNLPTSSIDMKWQHFTYRFRAAAATTTLTISDVTGINDVQGTALDGLSVTLAPDLNPPPAAAAGAPAAPTGLMVRATSAHQVTLAWTDPPAPRVPGPGETAVAVWRKGGGVDWARVGALAAHATSFTDSGLTPGTSYTYRVRVIGGNVASDWSNEASVTIP